MVLFLHSVFARGRVLLSLFPLFVWAPLSSQDPEGEPVAEIPNRFFQTQDNGGFFWQPAGNGALTSGDTQYLQSGLNWLVDGVPFEPAKAIVRSPDQYPDNAGISLEEERESLVLSRELWIDRERGGVRTLDTITNRGGSTSSLEVVLRTTYPFAWQSLHGVDGELLSKDPVLSLDPEDFGLIAHFSPAEGRHDTFFLVGGGEDSLKPRVSASSNRRELSFTYRMVIPSGGSQSLLHWIYQKSLPNLETVSNTFLPFYERSELVDPGLNTRQRIGISNFPPSALPEESSAPGDAETLLSLQTFLRSAELERRLEDTHWISATSQISGKVGGAESLLMQANHAGELSLPLNEIAAIYAEEGDKAVVFLRNGEVRTGVLLANEFTLIPTGSETPSKLKTNAIHVLLFGVSALDGKLAGNGKQFFQLLDQSVFAGTPKPETVLSVSTPYGPRAFSWESIEEVAHVAEPFSSYRILTQAGSNFSVFLVDSNLQLSAEKGDLELPLNLIDRIWFRGATSHSIPVKDDPWLDFDEVPGSEVGGFLLRGSEFLQGRLAEATLRFIDNDSVIQIESEAIQAISRDLRDNQRMITHLKGGETVSGIPLEPFIRILWEGEEFRIPFESLIAYQIPQR